MKLRLGPCMILAVLLTPLAWPQTGTGGSSSSSSSGSSQSGSDTSQSGSDTSQPQQASSGPKQVFNHPEQKPPLALLDEVPSPNFLNLGLSLGTSWDSNAAAFAAQGYSQTLITVQPFIGLQEVHPKVSWNLAYAGGFMYAPDRTYYNSMTHDATGSVLWQISPHWQITASDSYLYTADPFSAYLVQQGTPSYNQPNPTVYIPLATLEQNAATLNLTYQMTARDSLTFTGNENFRRYLHTSYSVYNEYTWGGLTAYQHVVSARMVVGGAYSFTSIDFGHGVSRSGVSMFQGFASYLVSPHVVVTGWIGPELTNTKSIIPVLCTPYGCFKEIVHQSSWNTAFGGTVGWNGIRNAISFTFAKQVTDGGGLLGVTRLFLASANYLRQITPLWSASLSGQYGTNTGISALYYHRHLDTLTGTFSLNRRFGPNWNATLQYLRFYERQKNIYTAAVPKWTDNRVAFTLQYNWGHSLGR